MASERGWQPGRPRSALMPFSAIKIVIKVVGAGGGKTRTRCKVSPACFGRLEQKNKISIVDLFCQKDSHFSCCLVAYLRLAMLVCRLDVITTLKHMISPLEILRTSYIGRDPVGGLGSLPLGETCRFNITPRTFLCLLQAFSVVSFRRAVLVWFEYRSHRGRCWSFRNIQSCSRRSNGKATSRLICQSAGVKRSLPSWAWFRLQHKHQRYSRTETEVQRGVYFISAPSNHSTPIMRRMLIYARDS